MRNRLKGRYIAPAISAFPPSLVVKPERKAVSLRTETSYDCRDAGGRVTQEQLPRRPSLWGEWRKITKPWVQEIR